MLVINRMSLLICYKIIMGPMLFFLPGAHSMLKPALYVLHSMYIFNINTKLLIHIYIHLFLGETNYISIYIYIYIYDYINKIT